VPPATILLVDDDPDILRLLTLTLRPEGFRLLSASDGNAALEIARAEHPDLLLLDWNMPGRNGLEVCHVLRDESDPDVRDVPVVLLTAQGAAEDTAAGFAAGVTDYVTKPFKPAHIRARVHAWLGRKRAGREGTGTMARFFFASLRARVFVLVLLAVLPALVLALYTNLEERQLRKALVQEDAMRLSRLVSADYKRLIEDARQLVVSLARLPAVRGRNRAACNAVFTDLLTQHSSYVNLGVVDADGNVLCSALPIADPVYL